MQRTLASWGVAVRLKYFVSPPGARNVAWISIHRVRFDISFYKKRVPSSVTLRSSDVSNFVAQYCLLKGIAADATCKTHRTTAEAGGAKDGGFALGKVWYKKKTAFSRPILNNRGQ